MALVRKKNLFRRSNYYQCLEDPDGLDSGRRWWYPLPEFGGVYSPQVWVFRKAEAKGYEFMEKPVPLSFLAVAAYRGPPLVGATGKQREKSKGKKGPKPEPMLPSKFVEKTKRKVRGMLAMGVMHNHDSLVLSAFGCGAYGNPPTHMAWLFREVIFKEFNGCFKNITFAIFDDHNARKAHNPEGNVLPFVKAFSSPSPKLVNPSSRGGVKGSDGGKKRNKNDGDESPDSGS